MKDFIKDIIIQCTETDKNKKYKVYAALCASQEAAQEHATKLHFGYDDLASVGSFWVLSRIKLRFNKPLFWRDSVRLSTWHKGSEGIFALRDFEFSIKNESEKVDDVYSVTVIAGTSSWLILDANTHKILRPEQVITDDYITTIKSKDSIKEPCGKLISPKDMTFTRTKEVCYSDIDMLGHTNNAKYIEWAFDSIDSDILYDNDIFEVQINFNTETRIGDRVDIYTKNIESVITDSIIQNYFIEGRIASKNVFQLILSVKR